MLREPTTSDPIQNRKLTKECWDGGHAHWEKDDYGRTLAGCPGWFLEKGQDNPDENSEQCACLCHEAQPNPKKRKLKPSDSLDLPDVGTITVGP